MHQAEFKIYETYLDSYGHVNNAKYLELYEQARWDWMADKGLERSLIESSGIGPVILNINIAYKREVLARQLITIQTQVLSYQKKIFNIQQKMLLPDGTVASEATITGGLWSMQDRKLVEPTPEWLKAFAEDGIAD